MKYLKIPQERIAILIGPKGKTRKQIQEIAGLHIDIDSQEGEVIIHDEQAQDPYLAMKAEDTVRAIARGFNPYDALKIFKEDNEFFLFDIHDYAGKQPNHVHRLKSRIIGREGKTKRVIETLTGSELSIYGHTVAIICDYRSMDIAKTAIDMLLSGSKHAGVYRYLEREMKKLRLSSVDDPGLF